MSTPAPHLFEDLLGSSSTQTTLLVGAGLSYLLVETPQQIVTRLAPMQNMVETRLGLANPCATIDPNKSEELYRWAGDVLAQLQLGGLSPSEGKLKIAESIGVTTEPAWRAKAKMPERGNTPRHRVIARLARENRWQTIWSLNWDIWLESALRSVGIEESSGISVSSDLPQAWITKYKTWVPDFSSPMEEDQTVVIIKPHGCVAALLKGGGLFVLTKEELATALQSQPGNVIDALTQSLANRQFVCVGWSASEPYLQGLFQQLAINGSLAAGKLTIIDAYPNSDGHQVLVDSYSTVREKAIFESKPPLVSTTDDLFRWMQARHGLLCLRQQFSSISSEYSSFLTYLKEYEQPIPVLRDLPWLTSWVDDFLPVWTRFCFNSGRVQFHRGTEIPINAVPTHRRDEHIPWNDQSTKRPDLKAAAHLLMKLATLGKNFGLNTENFPGALWSGKDGHLIVPVPAWGDTAPFTAAALKPLAGRYHWQSHGLIKRLSILPLSDDGATATFDPTFELSWKAEVASLMQITKWAISSNIETVTLGTLKEF